ncbi:aspartate/glutamate racemase family protein [Pseudomonas rhizosphaerae]|uniref:aspartate/glutamate racemase family protein n=1 Tax=Pseudomonas rhizosphaerae TaxID=216142 RepID=UPI002B47D636|nr:arylsulfatase [Pseudomonas rhizosphaerae]MEB2870125.1 arylsulfatase [Pseudomonas rhizosphaerae]
MSKQPRIFLIHATDVSITPINEAFRSLWPEAQLMNLWDDSLSVDIAASGSLTDNLRRRIHDLASHAFAADADAVLYTCSAFTDAMDVCKRRYSKPVLKPNEAMVIEAVSMGSRIAALTTFAPAVRPILDDFTDYASSVGKSIEVTPILCEGALQALKKGDAMEHNRIVRETAAALSGYDVICFAQFSMTQAAGEVRKVFNGPVLTTPESAVMHLKELLTV